MVATPRRAEPPRFPALSEAQKRTMAVERKRRALVEARERRGMVRGLLVLVLLILLLSIARAGLDRVFPHGWWRP